ncbi:hypothetical protein ACPWT1_12705 [Ramlibacter sp. MMS24-I3-19]|uniref:hypothetical protein n=1 Tax=Ramlibacter sp. MMS24-I3-19 TaxID=3416606 RepID=UPI003CFF8A3E
MRAPFEALRAELKPSGVAVTVAYPGVVATGIKHHRWNAQGRPGNAPALNEDDAMPVEECARLILDGLDERRRDVVMTTRGKLGRFLKLIAPGKVDDMALAVMSTAPRTP